MDFGGERDGGGGEDAAQIRGMLVAGVCIGTALVQRIKLGVRMRFWQQPTQTSRVLLPKGPCPYVHTPVSSVTSDVLLAAALQLQQN